MLKTFSALATFALLAQFSTQAMAGASVVVTLTDNGETLDLSKNMGMAPGTQMDMSKAPMA